METRFESIAALAAADHGIIALDQLRRAGIDSSLKAKWVGAGRLQRRGGRSFSLAGCPPSWMGDLAAGAADLDGYGLVAGRSAARLHHLDDFAGDALEFLLPRGRRHRRTAGVVCSTSRPLTSADIATIDGLRCLSAHRLMLEAPLFGFARREIENAIDSAIRRRLVSEQRLRTAAIATHTSGVNDSRMLLDALVDSGGESRLERWFLRLVRMAGLPRPTTQRTFRSEGRTIARVDAWFPGNLVIEVAGHGTHASRSQRQRDAQRHTELTLGGLRVVTFTYEDVRDRPAWVVAQLRIALAQAA